MSTTRTTTNMTTKPGVLRHSGRRSALALAAAAAAAALMLPALAEAQRKSPLADAPAVRNRLELRQKRAELGVGVGTTLNQDFWHAVMFNVRGSFHFTDSFGLGAFVGLNLTPNFKTGFHDRLIEVLPNSGAGKAPTKNDAEKAMNKIGEVVGLQLEATPFAGKYSMFGKIFLNYDFYAFAGPGFLHLKSEETNPCSAGMSVSCNVSGFKVGANFGFGMHTFFNNFFAVNVELRDILIRNNPSGRDVSGDKLATDDDLTWDSNYLLTLGFVLFLPTSASISP